MCHYLRHHCTCLDSTLIMQSLAMFCSIEHIWLTVFDTIQIGHAFLSYLSYYRHQFRSINFKFFIKFPWLDACYSCIGILCISCVWSAEKDSCKFTQSGFQNCRHGNWREGCDKRQCGWALGIISWFISMARNLPIWCEEHPSNVR